MTIKPILVSESREFTEEEMREQFLIGIHNRIEYWNNQRSDTLDKLEGLAFSILSMIDGCSMDSPGYSLIPFSDEVDIEYLRRNGENYYPVDSPDLGGCLHELFYNYKKDN